MSIDTKNLEACRPIEEFAAAAAMIVDASAPIAILFAECEPFRDFGPGSGRPARLSCGDRLAYALSRRRGELLLFIGDDFADAGLTPALP